MSTPAKNLTAAEKSVQAFLLWKASMGDDDYAQIVFRGQLNREQVAKGCGFAKAVLRQNPKVKELLHQLELDLRQRQVLPDLTEAAQIAATQPKAYDRTERQRITESRRVAELEAEVLELKARLRRFEELSEVLVEMGLGDSL